MKLDDKHMKLSKVWLQKIQQMKEFGKKSSFDKLKHFGVGYLAQEMIPRLILDAKRCLNP